jgi:hypothetical protein
MVLILLQLLLAVVEAQATMVVILFFQLLHLLVAVAVGHITQLVTMAVLAVVVLVVMPLVLVIRHR